ncbi:MAG: hypothetical protein LBR27_00760 [Bifidobacteriaceae bacterium]|jgi:hypothetical protein|nr:hypothetical protein [Bifidobacteriaceae bacterium]
MERRPDSRLWFSASAVTPDPATVMGRLPDGPVGSTSQWASCGDHPLSAGEELAHWEMTPGPSGQCVSVTVTAEAAVCGCLAVVTMAC